MKFNDLINILKEKNLLVNYNVINDELYNDVYYDSTKVNGKGILICKGLKFNKQYLLDAIEKGVTAYISEVDYNIPMNTIIVKNILDVMAIVSKAIYDDSNKDLTLIGVTGTKGKTTTVNFVHNILDVNTRNKNAYWTTIDHYDGKNNDSSHNTTPEIVDIYQLIKNAKKNNVPYFVLEVSSQASKLKRIETLDFSIGIFTNISYDHISPLEHASFEEYLDCKVNFLKKCKTVFLYRNSEYYEYIRKALDDKEIYTFGDTLNCDYMFSDIKNVDNGICFKVKNGNDIKDYKISMKGSFNVINATAAIAVANFLHIAYDDICEGLLKTWVIGRMNIYESKKCTVIVDYAHNKISAEALLKSLLSDYPNKNIKLVFGCPGDRGINRRKDIGELAGKFASYIYITSEDPQSKRAEDICEEIASYIRPYDKPYEIIIDREEAIKKAIKDAHKNDVIAIIGKGDETYQIINRQYVPYKSDIKVVEESLNIVLEK